MNKFEDLVESIICEAEDFNTLKNRREEISKELDNIGNELYREHEKYLDTIEDKVERDNIKKAQRKKRESMKRSLYKEVDKIDKKLANMKYRAADVKVALRKAKIKKAKHEGTSISGYSRLVNGGWRRDPYDEDRWDLISVNSSNTKKFTDELDKLGVEYTLGNKSKGIADSGSIQTITIKQLEV